MILLIPKSKHNRRTHHYQQQHSKYIPAFEGMLHASVCALTRTLLLIGSIISIFGIDFMPSATAQGQQQPYSNCGAQEKEYRYTPDVVSWEKAVDACAATLSTRVPGNVAGALATVRSGEEQRMLERLGWVSNVFLGGYRGDDDDWRWIGDNALFFSPVAGSTLDVDYNNFDADQGEPHSGNGSFHLMIFRATWGNYLWGDRIPCKYDLNTAWEATRDEENQKCDDVRGIETLETTTGCYGDCESNRQNDIALNDDCNESADHGGKCWSDLLFESCRKKCDDEHDECLADVVAEIEACHERRAPFVCEYCPATPSDSPVVDLSGPREVAGIVKGHCDRYGRMLIQRVTMDSVWRLNKPYEAVEELPLDGCGYLPESTVSVLAQYATSVTLEVTGQGEIISGVSTGVPMALQALVIGTNWHAEGVRWQQQRDGEGGSDSSNRWCFTVGCEPSATKWPDMYDSCGFSHCLRWLSSGPNYPSNHAAESGSGTTTEQQPGELFHGSQTWLTMQPGICDQPAATDTLAPSAWEWRRPENPDEASTFLTDPSWSRYWLLFILLPCVTCGLVIGGVFLLRRWREYAYKKGLAAAAADIDRREREAEEALRLQIEQMKTENTNTKQRNSGSGSESDPYYHERHYQYNNRTGRRQRFNANADPLDILDNSDDFDSILESERYLVFDTSDDSL